MKIEQEQKISEEKIKEIISGITRYETDARELAKALLDAKEVATGIYMLEFDLNNIIGFVICPRHHSKHQIVALSYFNGFDMRKLKVFVEIV
jgi:hypothetical protein